VNAREILRRLIRRFGLVLLLTVLGGIAGAVYGAVKTPTYTAKAYVVAIGDAGDPNTALNFAQAYGRVATTGPVLVKAGALLGSDTDGLDRVTSSTSPDAPVIEIDATGPSAEHTAAVANAVGRALSDYGSDRKADTHVGLALLAGATTPSRPTSPKPPLELLVGAAGGLLIGGLAVLAGAGRSDTRTAAGEPEPVGAPEQYTAEVPRPPFDRPAFDGPGLDEPAEIEGHLGVWRAQYGQKAITSYRSSAASADPAEDEEPAPEEAPAKAEPDGDEPRAINGAAFTGPIVGRATVAGMEDDD
jgi:capsular polysaccharide biosynthesis protein